MTGSIARMIKDKGFGFITPDDGGKDVFFHAQSCDGQYDNMNEGDKVTFDVEQGPKGPAAANIRVS